MSRLMIMFYFLKYKAIILWVLNIKSAIVISPLIRKMFIRKFSSTKFHRRWHLLRKFELFMPTGIDFDEKMMA